jgi:hypothetical protein
LPMAAAREYPRDHGVTWLAILAQAPQSMAAVAYAVHDRGFAGHMARTATVTRYYLQVPRGEAPEHWGEQRIWDELAIRMRSAEYGPLREGPILDLLELSFLVELGMSPADDRRGHRQRGGTARRRRRPRHPPGRQARRLRGERRRPPHRHRRSRRPRERADGRSGRRGPQGPALRGRHRERGPPRRACRVSLTIPACPARPPGEGTVVLIGSNRGHGQGNFEWPARN